MYHVKQRRFHDLLARVVEDLYAALDAVHLQEWQEVVNDVALPGFRLLQERPKIRFFTEDLVRCADLAPWQHQYALALRMPLTANTCRAHLQHPQNWVSN